MFPRPSCECSGRRVGSHRHFWCYEWNISLLWRSFSVEVSGVDSYKGRGWYLFRYLWGDKSFLVERRYSKEEEVGVEELRNRNFTYLVKWVFSSQILSHRRLQHLIKFCHGLSSEHPSVDGYKCLFSEEGFDRLELRRGFPPIVLVNWLVFGNI